MPKRVKGEAVSARVAIVAGAGGERRGAAGTVLPARCFDKVLLLDQGTDAAKARAELDWYPSHPALVDEFRPRELPQLMGD